MDAQDPGEHAVSATDVVPPVVRCVRDHRRPSWNIPCNECVAAYLREVRAAGGRVERTVTLVVAVEVPVDWTDADINDALQFQLDIGNLSDQDVDWLAMTVKRAQLMGKSRG